MWQEIESKIAVNEADKDLPSAPLRRAILAELKTTDVAPVHAAKKMAFFQLPGGETILWELTSPALNFFVDSTMTDKLEAAGFVIERRPFDHSRLPNGGRHSALSQEHSFGKEDCLCVKIQRPEDAVQLIDTLSEGNRIGEDVAISRDQIEAAMDAFISYKETGAHSEIFENYAESKEFRVRSTRQRPDKVFSSKPIVGFALKLKGLNGGWSKKTSAAAQLHNAGYIIVDEQDEPVEFPINKPFLIRDADRIRLCVLNYFIAPARESGETQVTINVGDFSRDLKLYDTRPNVCQALRGKLFQDLADVPPPKQDGPENGALRLYDMRGTAATELLRAGCSLNEIAVTMGWGLRHAGHIIEKYAATVPEVADEVLEKLIVARKKRSQIK